MGATGGDQLPSLGEVAAVALTATFGLDGTRVNLPDVLSPKEDFHVLLAQVNYARRLNASGMEVRARLVGQLTDSVLFSGERLSAGGETTVRGYRENAMPGRVLEIRELDGVGRLIVLICEDLAAPLPGKEVQARLAPDWIFTPILDGPITASGWVCQQAFEAARTHGCPRGPPAARAAAWSRWRAGPAWRQRRRRRRPARDGRPARWW